MATPRTTSPRLSPRPQHFTPSDQAGLAALQDADAQRRFAHYVDDSAGPDACHPWTGGRYASGHGKFFLQVGPRERTALVSRVVWALHYGPIPAGYLVRHRCPNAWCVNLAHFVLVLPVGHAQMTNDLGQNFYLNKTTCPAGHPYDDTNACRKVDGSRQCRECNKAYLRRRRLTDPERVKAYDRRKRARIYADPERHAHMLARERLYYARRKEHTAA